MESLDKLKEVIMSLPSSSDKHNLKVYIHQLEKEFEDYQSRSVTWGIADFQNQAEKFEGKNWREVYDETAFEEALYEMIEQHDATTGINWDVIDVYLDSCKK